MAKFKDLTTDQLRVERWRLYYWEPKTAGGISQKKEQLKKINAELYKRTGNDAYQLCLLTFYRNKPSV